MTLGFQLWRYFLVLWKKYNLRNFLKSKQQQIVALLREKCPYSERDRNNWTSGTRIRVDRNVRGGGILLYVTKNIPSKLLSIQPIHSKCFFVELNLRERKWLMSCSYNPHKNNIFKHIKILSKNLDLYSSQYENNIIFFLFSILCLTLIYRNFFIYLNSYLN